MKTLVPLVAAAFFALFILNVFVPYPPALQQAQDAGFDRNTIDTGLQLSFERRLLLWPSRFLELGLLAFLGLTSTGRRLADRLLLWFRDYRIPAALGVGFVYILLHEVYALPLGIARYVHLRSWDMSNQSLLEWLRDRYVSWGVDLVWEMIMGVGLYSLLILFPRFWWLLAALGASALGVAYAFFAPILIYPLFNDFTPLAETKWSQQEPRVRALIDKAGVPVKEILVMNASRQSNHTNAYFAGFGSTRRIVLYDTLLDKHTEAEIESVLAHELGHWQHDHIVKGIVLGTLGAIVGFLVLHGFLLYAINRPPWNLRSIADPAGLPLIILLSYLGSWAVMPVGNAVSRYFEVQADQASLDLAGQPEAFIASEQKMAKDNKSNVAPTPWNAWLFSTHPTTVERIRMAQEWQRQ